VSGESFDNSAGGQPIAMLPSATFDSHPPEGHIADGPFEGVQLDQLHIFAMPCNEYGWLVAQPKSGIYLVKKRYFTTTCEPPPLTFMCWLPDHLLLFSKVLLNSHKQILLTFIFDEINSLQVLQALPERTASRCTRQVALLPVRLVSNGSDNSRTRVVCVFQWGARIS
jgi:hypothetical protein